MKAIKIFGKYYLTTMIHQKVIDDVKVILNITKNIKVIKIL